MPSGGHLLDLENRANKFAIECARKVTFAPCTRCNKENEKHNPCVFVLRLFFHIHVQLTNIMIVFCKDMAWQNMACQNQRFYGGVGQAKWMCFVMMCFGVTTDKSGAFWGQSGGDLGATHGCEKQK
jgi:hypothetical protein